MAWRQLDPAEVAEKLQSSETGLASEEALRRYAQYGPNELVEKGRRSLWLMFLDQFRGFMILVLIAAAVVAGVIGEPVDSIAIAVIVLLNAVLGFVQECRAEKAMAALKKMAAPSAVVIRDGQAAPIPAQRLVPGDLVVLEAGNVVPTDLRLTEAVPLQIQEAALTGESKPVEKNSMTIKEPELSIGDRKSMAFKGTLVSCGRGGGALCPTPE